MKGIRFLWKKVLIFGTAALLLCLTACSSSSKTVSSSAVNNFAVTGGSQEMAQEGLQSDLTGEEASSAVSPSQDSSLQSSDKIIYSGSVDLQTLDYQGTVRQIKKSMADMGGFLESESEYNGNYNWYTDEEQKGLMSAVLTLRIPADQFEDFINSLDDLGQVMSRNTSAQNITKTYNDNEAVIQALTYEKERLLDMMDKAETIEDMIAIEQRLGDVETQLNQANTDKSNMDMDIDYSTVTVTVEEVKAYSDLDRAKDSFGSRLIRAFRLSWTGFVSFMQNFLLFLIRALPFLIVIAVVTFLIVTLIRHRKQGQNKKQ